VHFVDDQYDHGAEIAFWPVPVLDDDDEHSLAARVLRAEHLLYPRVVQSLAAGEFSLDSAGKVSPAFLKSPLPQLNPSADDAALIGQLETSLS
jgi:hypothetical protein